MLEVPKSPSPVGWALCSALVMGGCTSTSGADAGCLSATQACGAGGFCCVGLVCSVSEEICVTPFVSGNNATGAASGTSSGGVTATSASSGGGTTASGAGGSSSAATSASATSASASGATSSGAGGASSGGPGCGSQGSVCTPGSCCSGLTCNDQSCQACAAVGATCRTDVDCCDGTCTSGSCACNPAGGSCAGDSDCCSGSCQSGQCACSVWHCSDATSFFGTYCSACHNFTCSSPASDPNIVGELQSGAMPPGGSAQPSATEVNEMLQWIDCGEPQ